MPDLLTHVLLVYAVTTLLARRGVVPARFVPVAMVGATLPDLAKLALVVPPDAVAALVGVPGSFWALHTLGGVTVLSAAGAVPFPTVDRRRAFLAQFAGGSSHLFLDGLVLRADGRSPPYLYPVTWWEPPAGMVYQSSDPWLSVVALVVAGGVWVAGRQATHTGAPAEHGD